jgi:hypothetical protein
MKVLIFKSREIADNGDPIWEMKFATSTQAAKKTTPANQFDDSIDIPNEGPSHSEMKSFLMGEPIARSRPPATGQ